MKFLFVLLSYKKDQESSKSTLHAELYEQKPLCEKN
jgi:hypothetical protein